MCFQRILEASGVYRQVSDANLVCKMCPTKHSVVLTNVILFIRNIMAMCDYFRHAFGAYRSRFSNGMRKSK